MIVRLGERWDVAGIYIGEKTTEQHGRVPRERGYALRVSDVFDWVKAVDPELVA